MGTDDPGQLRVNELMMCYHLVCSSAAIGFYHTAHTHTQSCLLTMIKWRQQVSYTHKVGTAYSIRPNRCFQCEDFCVHGWLWLFGCVASHLTGILVNTHEPRFNQWALKLVKRHAQVLLVYLNWGLLQGIFNKTHVKKLLCCGQNSQNKSVDFCKCSIV